MGLFVFPLAEADAKEEAPAQSVHRGLVPRLSIESGIPLTDKANTPARLLLVQPCHLVN
jgi:hypothetical protein